MKFQKEPQDFIIPVSSFSRQYGSTAGEFGLATRNGSFTIR